MVPEKCNWFNSKIIKAVEGVQSGTLILEPVWSLADLGSRKNIYKFLMQWILH